MEPAGLGALQRAFEQLKQRLAAEGLFAEDLKRPLPPFPRRLAVVSSPTGAALRDVLSVLARRFPALEVRLYPVPVQGAEAAGRIAAALARAGAPDSGNDLVLLTRGGGSLEDLWAFNEEVVARAIHACALPVVCGVGHEVDVTIADFAADLRAPTPSAAAELIVPDAAELDARFARMAQRLGQLTHLRLERYRQRNTELGRRLERCHPRARLEQRSQRLDELDQRLRRTQTLLLEGERRRLAEATRRLGSASPALRIADLRSRTEVAGRRLVDRLRARLEHARAAQASAARALHALSPLATLARGYAIVSREDDGRILLSSSEAAVGDRVRARLAEGELSCRVEARQDPPQAPQRAATARKRGRST
jgi:exodeoxyribonuclease VII large subunit